MRIGTVSGSEQTPCNGCFYCDLFLSFSPHLSVSLGTSRPSEFKARVVSAQKLGLGRAVTSLWRLVPDLGVSVYK